MPAKKSAGHSLRVLIYALFFVIQGESGRASQKTSRLWQEEEMSDLPAAVEKEKEKFFHPETGEEISKNAWKKLQKPAKVKKEKVAPPPPGEKKEKKEKGEEGGGDLRG